MIKNIFGTDGIRAPVGTAPLTLETIPHLGKAIAQWACHKYGSNAQILLAHDTRISCSFVKSVLKSGMLLYPLTIYDAGILPSPAVVQLLYMQQQFHAGIIISASHNPYQDNGIKLIDGAHGKLSLQDEQSISELFLQHSFVAQHSYHTLGTDIPWLEASEQYTENIMSFFDPQFLRDITVVLDCAYGAAYAIAPTILRSFGAQVITLHDTPDGKNINHHCGALHPDALSKAVVEYGAHIGFAFDGDADRVIAVNRQGDVKDGDDILAFLLQHPRYAGSTALVGTSMTNQGFEQFLLRHNKRLIRTPVGDKYVSGALSEHNLPLGGEPSGHIIVRDYLNVGDGIFTALRVLETMLMTGNVDMHTFVKFPQIILNVPVRYKKDLSQEPLVSLITQAQQQLRKGRVVVRYSGTEQLVRIMVEDEDDTLTHSLGNFLSQQLALMLNEDS